MNDRNTPGASDFEELARSIREHRAILFVGAGASMSVGLPSWRELIEHMAEELDVDPEGFSGSNSHHAGRILSHQAGQHRSTAQLDGPALEGFGRKGPQLENP